MVRSKHQVLDLKNKLKLGTIYTPNSNWQARGRIIQKDEILFLMDYDYCPDIILIVWIDNRGALVYNGWPHVQIGDENWLDNFFK